MNIYSSSLPVLSPYFLSEASVALVWAKNIIFLLSLFLVNALAKSGVFKKKKKKSSLFVPDMNDTSNVILSDQTYVFSMANDKTGEKKNEG